MYRARRPVRKKMVQQAEDGIYVMHICAGSSGSAPRQKEAAWHMATEKWQRKGSKIEQKGRSHQQ